MDTYNTFHPGKPWKDTDGKLIQTHGGGVLHHEGVYYWYGENKELYVAGGKNWHNGVSCYSSTDLYNWKNEGIILETSDDPSNPMHPERIMDRPHILYNKRTKQFVMWVKFAGSSESPFDWRIQYMGIAVSDHITKPFKMVKLIRPLGMETGDFDIYADPRDGKGYFIADRVHTEVVVADLTDDYLDVTGYYSSHFPRVAPPIAREAPCFFKKEDNYYILSSGTTGYVPNPSEIAGAKLMHGPYTVYGNPCLNDINQNSFDSQYCSVFKHPTRENLYIAIGDRWCYKTVEANGRQEAETSEATYVWLPIMFQGDVPYILWRDEWSLDEFPELGDNRPKEWWE